MVTGDRCFGPFAQLSAQVVRAKCSLLVAGVVVHGEPAAQGDDHADDLLPVDFQRAADAGQFAGFEAGEAVQVGCFDEVFAAAEDAR